MGAARLRIAAWSSVFEYRKASACACFDASLTHAQRLVLAGFAARASGTHAQHVRDVVREHLDQELEKILQPSAARPYQVLPKPVAMSDRGMPTFVFLSSAAISGARFFYSRPSPRADKIARMRLPQTGCCGRYMHSS